MKSTKLTSPEERNSCFNWGCILMSVKICGFRKTIRLPTFQANCIIGRTTIFGSMDRPLVFDRLATFSCYGILKKYLWYESTRSQQHRRSYFICCEKHKDNLDDSMSVNELYITATHARKELTSASSCEDIRNFVWMSILSEQIFVLKLMVNLNSKEVIFAFHSL
jgi:hypothetical protein